MRRYAPKAKLYLHQPWAYEEGSSRLLDVAKYDNAERMLGDVVRVNSEIADLIGADGVIRSGELFGALQKKGFRERIGIPITPPSASEDMRLGCCGIERLPAIRS